MSSGSNHASALDTETQARWIGITNLNHADTIFAIEPYASAGLPMVPICTPILMPNGELLCTHSFTRYESQGTIGPACESIGKNSLIKWGAEARAAGEGPTHEIHKLKELWQRFHVEIDGISYYPNIGAILGVPTTLWYGKSNFIPASLIAIDLDLKEVDGQFVDGETVFQNYCSNLGVSGEAIPPTLTQRTGSGGKQLIFLDPSTPEVQVRQTVPWHQCVDLKAIGGLIILPPSRHVEGNTYQWVDDLAPVAPGPLLSAALKNAKITRSASPTGGRKADGTFENDVDLKTVRISGARKGGRDAAFRDLVYACRKQGLNEQEARVEVERVWHLSENSPAGHSDHYKLETALEKVTYTYSKSNIKPDPEANGRLPGDVDPELQPFIAKAQEYISTLKNTNGHQDFVNSTIALMHPEQTIESDIGQYKSPPIGESIDEQFKNIENIPSAQVSDNEGFTDYGTGNRLLRLYRDETDGHSPWAGTEGVVIRSYDDNVNYVWDPKTDVTKWQIKSKEDVYEYMIAAVKDLEGMYDRTQDPDKKKEIFKYISYARSKAARLNFRYEFLNKSAIKIDPDEFDNDSNMINTTNCVVDLRTGEMYQHHWKFMTTQCTQVPYIPEAAQRGYAPLLDNFFDYFIPDQTDQEIFYRMIGSTLFGKNGARSFIIIRGKSSTGKGTIVEMIMNILNDYAEPVDLGVFKDAETSKPRPDIITAARARLINISELSEKNVLHNSQIKRITGGAPLSARFGHSNNMMKIQPRFTPLIDTNHVPSIPGADEALKNRLFVFVMDRSISSSQLDSGETKEALHADVRSQESLLARIIQGAAEFKKKKLNPRYGMPDKYRRYVDQIFRDLSDITDVIDWGVEINRLELDTGRKLGECITLRELFDIYRLWAEGNLQGDGKRATLGYKAFSRAINEHYSVEKYGVMRVKGIIAKVKVG